MKVQFPSNVELLVAANVIKSVFNLKSLLKEFLNHRKVVILNLQSQTHYNVIIRYIVEAELNFEFFESFHFIF